MNSVALNSVEMHVRRCSVFFVCHVWVYFPVHRVIVCERTVGNSFSSHGYLFWVGVYERIISQIIQEVNHALPSRVILIQMLCLTGFT